MTRDAVLAMVLLVLSLVLSGCGTDWDELAEHPGIQPLEGSELVAEERVRANLFRPATVRRVYAVDLPPEEIIEAYKARLNGHRFSEDVYGRDFLVVDGHIRIGIALGIKPELAVEAEAKAPPGCSLVEVRASTDE